MLPDVQREFGDDHRVIAVQVTGSGEGSFRGTVAFVLRRDDGRVVVRRYRRSCAGGGNSATTNDSPFCLRRTRTLVRRATAADRGPTVALGALSADAVERLQDAGKHPESEAVLRRGRWMFTASGSLDVRSAAPDGTGVRAVRDDDAARAASASVQALIGDR